MKVQIQNKISDSHLILTGLLAKHNIQLSTANFSSVLIDFFGSHFNKELSKLSNSELLNRCNKEGSQCFIVDNETLPTKIEWKFDDLLSDLEFSLVEDPILKNDGTVRACIIRRVSGSPEPKSSKFEFKGIWMEQGDICSLH